MVLYASLMGVGALIQWVMVVRLRSAALGRLIRWAGLPLIGISIAVQLGLLPIDATSGEAAGAIVDDVLSPLAWGCLIGGFIFRAPAEAPSSSY